MLKSNFVSSRQNHAMVRRSWNKSHSPGHTNDCGSWSLIGRSHTLERCMRIESQINLTCVAARIECVRQRNGTHPRKLARRARGELLWPPVPAAETLGQANNKIFDRQRHDDMTDVLILWCLQCWSKKEISLGWFCPSLPKNFALSHIFPVLWIHKKRSLRDKTYPKAPVVAIKSHLYPIELQWTPH